MRWGVFSDIHSNLEALEAVVKAYKSEGIDAYLCLGDIVGYGANPLECIQLTREISRITITGNHDCATVGLFPLEYFNDWAKKAVLWTRQVIDSANHNFLTSLKFDYKNKDLILVHGSLNQPPEFNYMTDFREASRTFSLMDKPICFLGHTHVVGMFIQDRQQGIDYCSEVNFKLKESCRYIVNVGSVGQPRDGNHQAGFAIFDTKKQTVSVKRVSYDIKSAQEKIIAAGLPSFLAARLSQGR
ncbi:MAG: metallophosphoesterase family protein [Candidatus Omnitrophota bacterium]|jgi:predicted phosphodiesterase